MNEAEFFVIEQIAKPIATKKAFDIQCIAESKYPRSKLFAAQLESLLAELTLQNIVVCQLINFEQPGSAAGEEFIRDVYAKYIEAATRRWHQQDLKDARVRGDL